MNWGRAKTILIILFLLIDVFLFVLLSYVQNDVSYIKQRTIEETASVLNGHGITIACEQIPRKRMKNFSLQIENLLHNQELLAERFLGKNYNIISENEKTITYQNGKTTLLVSNDEFLLEKPRNIRKIYSYDEIKKVLYKDLKNFGYDDEDIGLKNYYIKDGVCYISAFHTYKGNRIQNSELLISADKDGILSLGGKCFLITDAHDTEENVVDVTSALIDMIYNSEYSGMVVKKVELAYRMNFEYESTSKASAHPVYIVTDVNNKEYIFKANN